MSLPVNIHFDQAVFQTSLMQLQYYQSLPLLSASNQTNFLTNRYPNLMRVACLCAAADFMKDSEEYQKQFSRLTQIYRRPVIKNPNVSRPPSCQNQPQVALRHHYSQAALIMGRMLMDRITKSLLDEF